MRHWVSQRPPIAWLRFSYSSSRSFPRGLLRFIPGGWSVYVLHALCTGTLFTIKAHAVEVSQRVRLRLQDDGLPIDTTAAGALRSIVVREGFKTTDDLADAAVVKNVVDGPCIAFGEGELVTADGGVPA
jgi:hypothetical protein